ncbi:MAG: PH domain-containing protein [Tissierellia bacterium]|nr:PH domain-containing protein [Tissierellia bacterium]
MNFIALIFLPMVPILYYSSIKNLKYNKNILLGTSLPWEIVENGNEDIDKLISKIKFQIKILMAIMSISIILLMFYIIDSSIYIFIMIFSFLLLPLIFSKGMKDLRELKKQKGWIGDRNYKRISDLSLYTKNLESEINSYMLIIPIAIVLFISYIEFINSKYLGRLSTGIIILISDILIFFIYKRQASKSYTYDSEKNVKINQYEKINKTNLSYYSTVFDAILYAAFIYFYSKDIFNTALIIAYFSIIAISKIWIFKSFIKDRERIDEILRKVDEKFVPEIDDIYDYWGYNDPTDSRIFIPDPINIGNTSINRGHPKGKAVFYFGNLTFALLIIFTLVYFVFIGKMEFQTKLSNEKINIKAFPYSYEIEYKDIKVLNLEDSMPDKKSIRTNGTATENIAYGFFQIEDIGKVRLYYHTGKKVIYIETDKDKIFLNQKTDDKTEKLYNEIKSHIE